MKAFYLCDDPLGIKPDGMIGYVYTPDRPRFFATLLKLDPSQPMPSMNYAGCNVMFRFEPGDGTKEFYLLGTVQNIDKASVDTLTDALSECAEWYATCLNQESHERTGKNGGWVLLSDYNEHINAQLLCFERSGTYLLGYANGIKDFKSLEDVRAYMRDQLGYATLLVADGRLNRG
jgi:hypothetical protein